MSDSPATDPNQYDSSDLDWGYYGAEDNKTRVFFRESLGMLLKPESLKDRSILDIGCGMGQLFNWLKNNGAAEVSGIDPSVKNIVLAKEHYPWVSLTQATLRDYASSYSGEKFDVATAILVFEHIENLNEAFGDVSTLLVEGGEFYLIIGDNDYYTSNDPSIRGRNFVSAEVLRKLDGGASEIKSIRKVKGGEEQSVIYDIFRPLDVVLEAAKDAGFEVVSHQPLIGPISNPIEERNVVFCHALRFKKRGIN